MRPKSQAEGASHAACPLLPCDLCGLCTFRMVTRIYGDTTAQMGHAVYSIACGLSGEDPRRRSRTSLSCQQRSGDDVKDSRAQRNESIRQRSCRLSSTPCQSTHYFVKAFLSRAGLAKAGYSCLGHPWAVILRQARRRCHDDTQQRHQCEPGIGQTAVDKLLGISGKTGAQNDR